MVDSLSAALALPHRRLATYDVAPDRANCQPFYFFLTISRADLTEISTRPTHRTCRALGGAIVGVGKLGSARPRRCASIESEPTGVYVSGRLLGSKNVPDDSRLP